MILGLVKGFFFHNNFVYAARASLLAAVKHALKYTTITLKIYHFFATTIAMIESSLSLEFAPYTIVTSNRVGKYPFNKTSKITSLSVLFESSG